ncbi:MAG: hypothetical protein IKG87_06540, partial [Clostridia bacterium]|nr:hypothetical protein [Clostridia bacterium]
MKDYDSIMKRRRRFFAIMLAKTMICGLAVPKSSLAEIRQYDGEPKCESKNNPEYEAYEGHAPHCYDDSNIKYYPNCKEGGYILSSCIYCGNDLEVTQVLPSDHAMTHVTAKDPTCTEDGNYEYWYCSKCHAYFEDADGETEYDIDMYKRPHLGHNITEQASRKEPTCTEPGNYAYSYCSECKKHFDENGKEFEDGGWVIPAAHKLTTTNANPATCTTDGNSAYSYCSECKKYFDADGKEINEGDWVIPAAHKLTTTNANPATCTTDGNSAYSYCSECKKYFDADGKEINEGDWVIHAAHKLTSTDANPATCTTDGNSAYSYCSECKKYFDASGKEINEGDWVIHAAHKLTTTDAKAATCTTDGNSAYSYCSECKKYFDADGKEINEGD